MKKNGRNKKRDLSALGLTIIILILLNFVGSFVFHRFDLTSEKRYTLSDATKKLLSKLNDQVYVKVYLEGEFPAGFKLLRNETKEMLDEFRRYSNDNVEYEFINPSANPDKQQQIEVFKQLKKKGLHGQRIEDTDETKKTVQTVWPGAIVSYKGHEMAWNLLKTQTGKSAESQLNSSIQGLEYEFASCIRNLSVLMKPDIAFIEGQDELDTLAVKDITTALEEFYVVKRVAINEHLDALKDLKAIIIAKPDSSFSEKDKFIIDQYIMKGGKVLWAIDPLYTSIDSIKKNQQTMAVPYDLNLDDLLFKYGVRINQNLVLDVQCGALPINKAMRGDAPNIVPAPWIFFPLAAPSDAHPITKNLDVVKMEYAGSIDTVGAKGIKKTILLQSSKYSKTIMAPVRVDLNYLGGQPDETKFQDSYRPLAVLLEGKFKSIFENRPFLPNQQMDEEFKKQIGFQTSGVDTKMIVISDGDIIKNDLLPGSGKPLPLGMDRFGQTYGNKNFIMNCINYLCDDSGLISVRSRELTLRLLDKKKVKNERLKWELINTFVPLLLIILFGLIQNWRRKRKYAN